MIGPDVALTSALSLLAQHYNVHPINKSVQRRSLFRVSEAEREHMRAAFVPQRMPAVKTLIVAEEAKAKMAYSNDNLEEEDA